MLVSDPIRVFSKKELLEEVWGYPHRRADPDAGLAREPAAAQTRPRAQPLRDQLLGRRLPAGRRMTRAGPGIRRLGARGVDGGGDRGPGRCATGAAAQRDQRGAARAAPAAAGARPRRPPAGRRRRRRELDPARRGGARAPRPRGQRRRRRAGAEPVRCEAALRSAVGRWRARVALGGGSLELRWWAGEATVVGDRAALEQAVDNLIVNAIEHGGPAILVEGRRARRAPADLGRRLAAAGAIRGAPARRERAATPAAGADRAASPAGAAAGTASPSSAASPPSTGAASSCAAAAGGSVAILDLPLRRGPIAPPTRRMSRRARAALFLALALLAAAAAAAIVAGYGSSVARGYGPLRRVVVLEPGLPAGRPIGPRRGRLAAGRAAGAGALRPGGRPAPCPATRSAWCPRGPAPAGSYLLAAPAAAAAPGSGGRAWPAIAGRSRSRSAAPTRCSPSAGARGGAGRRGRHQRTDRPGPGPDLRRRRGRAAAGARPGRRRPRPGRDRGGDAGADPAPRRCA